MTMCKKGGKSERDAAVSLTVADLATSLYKLDYKYNCCKEKEGFGYLVKGLLRYFIFGFGLDTVTEY